MNFNFETFPTLKTDRIILREISFEDAKVILELRSNEEINKFVATKRMQNLAEADTFIALCHEIFTK
jgi:ribosomal-protein-alanine N-acetyltransferase